MNRSEPLDEKETTDKMEWIKNNVSIYLHIIGLNVHILGISSTQVDNER